MAVASEDAGHEFVIVIEVAREPCGCGRLRRLRIASIGPEGSNAILIEGRGPRFVLSAG